MKYGGLQALKPNASQLLQRQRRLGIRSTLRQPIDGDGHRRYGDDQLDGSGRSPPRIRLPNAALLPIPYAAEAVGRLTGRTTRVRWNPYVWRASACSS